MPKNWGSDVIPMSDWIDPKKEYKTRSGHRVVDIKIELYNSNGDEVTYPVKGSIVIRENPRKLKYSIWSLTGLTNVVWPDQFSQEDLIEVK